ncbi:MAG: hypothetical protein AAFY03_09995 [Pseudomonadota bacterium]
MRAVLALLACLALAGCQTGEGSDGGASGQGGNLAPVGEALVEEQREACESGGGTFGRAPNGLNLCFSTPRDAGQRCEQNSDCEGVCLARSRTCAPLIPLVGCNEVLVGPGRVLTECRQQD